MEDLFCDILSETDLPHCELDEDVLDIVGAIFLSVHFIFFGLCTIFLLPFSENSFHSLASSIVQHGDCGMPVSTNIYLFTHGDRQLVNCALQRAWPTIFHNVNCLFKKPLLQVPR